MNQQKDGTTSPDGRREGKDKKKKDREEESSDTELEKPNMSMSSWWGKDDTRDPREGRNRGAEMITTIIKEKNKHN